jgi:hypothetical protein
VLVLSLPSRQWPTAVDCCLSREQFSYHMPGAASSSCPWHAAGPCAWHVRSAARWTARPSRRVKTPMDMTIVAGPVRASLAETVAAQLGRRLGTWTVQRFPDNEFHVALHDSARGHDVDLSPVWTRCWQRPAGACTSIARSVTSWSTRESARSRRGGEAFLLQQDVRRPDNVSAWPAHDGLWPVLRGGATRPAELSVGSAPASGPDLWHDSCSRAVVDGRMTHNEGRGHVNLCPLRRRSRGERAPMKLGALC